MNQYSKTNKEYKVIVMGDSGVGKTSIIQRFVSHTFDYSMDATIGAAFVSTVIPTQIGRATLNIWDTAGQEKYRSLLQTYSRDANAAIFVYDLTSETSFENIDKWLNELYKYTNKDSAILFIVGNKSDLEETVPEISAQQWAKAHNALYLKTSAENGKGIKTLFETVATLLLEKQPNVQKEQLPNIDHLKPKNKKSGCC